MGCKGNTLHQQPPGKERALRSATVSPAQTMRCFNLCKAHHYINRHIHWKQSEYFQIEQGVIGIHKNGKEIRATKDDGIIEVPAGTR